MMMMLLDETSSSFALLCNFSLDTNTLMLTLTHTHTYMHSLTNKQTHYFYIACSVHLLHHHCIPRNILYVCVCTEITLGGTPPSLNSTRTNNSGFLSPTIQISRPASKNFMRSKSPRARASLYTQPHITTCLHLSATVF